MSHLPDLFRNSSTLAALRPAAIQQFALQHLQLPPQEQAAEPQLLQKLYEYLERATLQEAIEKCTDRQHGVKQQRRRQLAAHHAVFELLLGSLTTYRPLLLRIKQAYDDALQDATVAACDNVFLHDLLSMVPHRHAEAVDRASQLALDTTATMENELRCKLSTVQQQTLQVEDECQVVEEQLQQLHKHMLQSRRELDQLEAFNRRMHKELLSTSSWQMLSTGSHEDVCAATLHTQLN